MVVLILTACSAGLRGHLTRWMMEVSPGVFVGKLNPRLRDHVWALTIEDGSGRALLVYKDRSAEQGFSVRSSDHDWRPTDFDGVTMMRRSSGSGSSMKKGWSAASRYRRRRG
ncbi:type I-E CRISPR-associated endoribonuclease Cas2e [Actinomycetaceae bacterium MB13-C1-2]|nr:type I-E CRISPR-associated endoribonuclease Cas2e [Actinomycetaceae bacterium MB13-C1-2]